MTLAKEPKCEPRQSGSGASFTNHDSRLTRAKEYEQSYHIVKT